MKKIFFFLILNTLILLLCAGWIKKPFKYTSTQAIYDVINELFLRRGTYFEIVIFGQLTARVGDKIDGIVGKINGSQNLRIFQYPKFVNLDESSVIFCDWKVVDPVKIRRMTAAKKFFVNLKTFLFVFESEIRDLKLMAVNPGSFVGHFSQRSYFIVDSNEEVKLQTFEWWTEKSCNELQVTNFNSFNKTSRTWHNPLKIPQKFSNFHNCTLKSYSNILPITLFDYIRESGFLTNSFLPEIVPESKKSFFTDFAPKVFSQREILERKIIEIFAELGNFTILRPHYLDVGYQFHEHIGIKQDFVLYQRSYSYRFPEHSCSFAFTDQKIRVMYSPVTPYTNYEKLILPYDYLTWLFLCYTFGTAFLIIFVMNLLPRFIKDVVYGEDVSMPSFNVVRTFFGDGQTRLPRNNFARIILMHFILFCMVVRTAYQGKKILY